MVKKISGSERFTCFDGRFDILQLFAVIPPHQEHPALDAARLAGSHSGLHLFNGNAAFHGVEDSLRAALRADPHAEATEFGQQINDFVVQAIRAGNTLKRNPQSAPPHFRGVLAQPAVVNGEHIVGNPHHVRLIGGKKPLYLVYDGMSCGAGASCQIPDDCTIGTYKDIRAR